MGKVPTGRAADHSPLLVSWSCKSRAIPLPTLWAATGPVTGITFVWVHIYAAMLNFQLLFYLNSSIRSPVCKPCIFTLCFVRKFLPSRLKRRRSTVLPTGKRTFLLVQDLGTLQAPGCICKNGLCVILNKCMESE